jgi:D-alanyl-D-alanine carboxypeptidase/D-alanyl-D-alanine-endopeptidase (penicillin-binding protein 4)
MKTITSAAGLARFGADHEFETYLAIQGDDLWVIGTGDPGIGDPRLASDKGELPTAVFDRWADQLEQRGLTRIQGDLVYDDYALDKWWLHPAWGDDIVHWYAAPLSGLNLHDNCIDITIKPTQPGRPVTWTVMPPVRNITVINNCVTGDQHAPRVDKQLGSNTYVLSGSASKEQVLKSKPVEDPGAFFADALRTHLASRGITVSGATRRAEQPKYGQPHDRAVEIIATHKSPLRDVIRRINANSQNFFADAMLKLSGQDYAARLGRTVPGTWEDGSAASRKFIRDLGINDLPLFVDDGSGLSRQNKVTARILTDMFIAMSRRGDFDVYRESMAISGTAGSLHNRMLNIKGRVYGKTGYISEVRALSGYLKDQRWSLAGLLVYLQ